MMFVEGVHYKRITHKKYKYELLIDYERELNGFQKFSNDYIELTYERLIVKKGYCWDGASGGFPDFCDIMRGSLVHDVFYQIIRDEDLPKQEKLALKRYADYKLRKICIEDGMSEWLANSVHYAVEFFGSLFGRL